MRATSTVVDATLCLLLVSAAVVTLASGDRARATEGDADSADEIASVLAATTTEVNYSIASGPGDPTIERTTSGTVAGLLATAAIVSVPTDASTAGARDFQRAVAAVTRETISISDHHVNVRAVWEPYPGAPVAGEVRVGPTPPPTAKVHTATFLVESGLNRSGDAAIDVADDEYGAVATVVARAVVEGLFPPGPTGYVLRRNGPAARAIAARYGRFAGMVGVSLADSIEAGNASAANDRLSGALADYLLADMRERYDSPSSVARAVDLGRTRIVVRTWS